MNVAVDWSSSLQEPNGRKCLLKRQATAGVMVSRLLVMASVSEVSAETLCKKERPRRKTVCRQSPVESIQRLGEPRSGSQL